MTTPIHRPASSPLGFLYLSIAVSAVLLSCLCTSVAGSGVYVQTDYFHVELFPTLKSGGAYRVGQDVRLRLSAQIPSANVGFNRSTVRVAVNALYLNRAQSGVPIPCNSSQTSTFFDSGVLGTSAYSTVGTYVVYSAYVTFSVPPFPWRICILNQPKFRSEYHSAEAPNTVYPRKYNETAVFFVPAGVMQETDYAAIGITRVGISFNFQQTLPGPDGLDGDSVKLVPAGTPCAQEKISSREGANEYDYCGSNNVDVNGTWLHERCILEGSVSLGVARIGTNAVNPFVSNLTVAGLPRLLRANAGEPMVAYLQLPVYGVYDVCYSPLTYRKAMRARQTAMGMPVWFKLMQFSAACRRDPIACQSRTRLTILSRSLAPLIWSLQGSPIAGSYGSLRIRGAGDLSSALATAWDPRCTTACTKEFYNTTGGDVFRLVKLTRFQSLPEFDLPVAQTIRGATGLFGGGAEEYTAANNAMPSVGSATPNLGCWNSDDDNYGTEETPMGQPLCPGCETGNLGQTASGNLGGDPRSSEISYLQDQNNQFLTFARIRIPDQGTWRVCYRKRGLNNWQYLGWDTLVARPNFGFFSLTTTDIHVLQDANLLANFSYTLNDTRRDTWPQIRVTSTATNMETVPSTYFTSSVAIAAVRGSILKIVDRTERCDRVARTDAVSRDAGTIECSPLACNFSTVCDGCKGSTDDSFVTRNQIYFHVRLPKDIAMIRVCFRYRAELWRILRPTGDHRNKLQALVPPPAVRYTIVDRSIGSWGRFVFHRNDSGLIDIRPYTGFEGSMFHIIVSTSRCDLVWSNATTHPQDYSNLTVDTDLAVFCRTRKGGISPPSDLCTKQIINTTLGTQSATFPYSDINSYGNGFAAQAVGFALISNVDPVAYRVCFKEVNTSWYEILPQLQPIHAPQYQLTSPTSGFYAGQYVSLTVTSSVPASILPANAMVKVVYEFDTCEFPALGTHGTDGTEFSSFTQALKFGSRVVGVGSAQSGMYTSANAFLTLPTFEAPVSATVQYRRRVCFAPAKLATTNWVDLGLIAMTSLPIDYTTYTPPYNGALFSILIRSRKPEGLSNGDRLKIVQQSSPCAAEGALPDGVTSYHVGMELLNQNYASIANMTAGIGNGTVHAGSAAAWFELTLPGGRHGIAHRVCYKSGQLPWQEILQSNASHRVYDLGSAGFISIPRGAYYLNIDPVMTGTTPATGYTYAGFSYGDLVPAGVTTAFTPASVGLSGDAVNYFSVFGEGLSITDELKIVLIQEELSAIATYASPTVINCEDDQVQFNIAASYAPSSVAADARTANFTFTLPSVPGRYLYCYTRDGEGFAYQPFTRKKNPMMLVSTSVYLKKYPSYLQVIDGSQSLSSNVGSVAKDDALYVAARGAVCGVGNAYDGTTPVSSAVVGLTKTGVAANTAYNLLNVSSASWYPIATAGVFMACYRKSLDTKTVEGTHILPIVNAKVWYNIPFFTDGFFTALHRVTTQLPSLAVSCPVSASPRTAGASFEVSAVVIDLSTGEPIATSIPIVVIVWAKNTWSLFAGCNNGGRGNITGTDHIATVSTVNGTARFCIKPLSACPSGGCQYFFSSTATAANSSVCSFTVDTTSAIASLSSSVVRSVPMTKAANVCELNKPCTVTFRALDANAITVYTAVGSVDVTTGTFAGIGFSTDGGASSTSSLAAMIDFANGVATVVFTPTIANAAAWPTATAQYRIAVKANVTATRSIGSSVEVVILRPSLAFALITDLFPINWDGTPANSVESNKHRKWEPSGTFARFWNTRENQINISAAAGYYLHAGQYYNVSVVALDQFGQRVPDPGFFTGVSLTVSIVPGNSASFFGSNWAVGPAASLEASYSFQTPFAATRFTSVAQDFIFRVRNADGCQPSVGGCSIHFAFGSAVVTTVKTRVRSPATKLLVTCAVPGNAVPTNHFTVACPSSAVEKGLSMYFRAVDPFDVQDEYFVGPLYATAIQNNFSAIRIDVSTVSGLLAGVEQMQDVFFIAGALVIRDITLTQPCLNCQMRFFSSWNIGYGTISVVFAPSSVKLTCKLSTTRAYYMMDSSYQSVVGRYDPTVSQDRLVAVYPSTDVCFDVMAVNTEDKPTLYESLWVNYGVDGLQGKTVRVTPSAATPYFYQPLNNSRRTFCFNVEGERGTLFRATFFAQTYADLTHWSSTVRGVCTTASMRLTINRVIGGIAFSTISGDMTSVAGYAPPKMTAGNSNGNASWLQTTLQDINQQLSLSVLMSMVDHYGNIFNSSTLQSSQSSLFITISDCSSSDISGGTCSGNGGASSKIAISSILKVQESGILQIVLQSATYVLFSPELQFSFSIRRWCLRCTVQFAVFSGNSFFVDVVNGRMTATMALSVIMPDQAPKYVAFVSGNSPFFPSAPTPAGFAATPWKHWMPSTPFASQPRAATGPMLFNLACINGSIPSCSPNTRLYMSTPCTSANSEVLTGADGGDMEFAVYRSTQAPTYGEITCVGDCVTGTNTPTSQVDIFNSYTVFLTVGTQDLQCVGTTPCTGNGGNRLQQTISALGNTVSRALLALFGGAPASHAKMRVVGLQSSSYTPTDPITGVVASGSAIVSRSGPLAVSAVRSPASAQAIINMTSVSGSGGDAGVYYLMWKGPSRATKIVALPTAVGASCPVDTLVSRYAAAGSATYNGYLRPTRIDEIYISYTNATIPVNQPFPFSMEVRDTNNNLVATAQGTVSVKIVEWFGKGSGGTATIVGSSSFSNGRTLVWVKFSEPCESCSVLFSIDANPAQNSIYELVLANDETQQVLLTSLVIAGTTQGTSVAAFSVTPAAQQPSTVSVDDTISVTVQAYSVLSDTLAFADETSPITIHAFVGINDTITDPIPQGDGGILRLAAVHSNASNFDRNAVTASGTGNATLQFMFQRTCLGGCSVIVRWFLPNTNSSGSFTLQHRNTSATGRTDFTVTSTKTFSTHFGASPRTVLSNTTYPVALWTALRGNGLPFVGYNPVASPPVTMPTYTVLDAYVGDGGRLSVNTTLHKGNVIQHIKLRKPCYLCNVNFGTEAQLKLCFQAVATHYRITSLTPRNAQPSSKFAMSLYASDGEGFMDVTKGGQKRCEYVTPFFCSTAGLLLQLIPSQDGQQPNFFYPIRPGMTAGGPTVPGFSLNTSGTFEVKDGRTNPTTGISFYAYGPVSRAVPIIADVANITSQQYPTFSFGIDQPTEQLSLQVDRTSISTQVFKVLALAVSLTRYDPVTGTSAIVRNHNNTFLMELSGNCPVSSKESVYKRAVDGVVIFPLVFTAPNENGENCIATFTNVAGLAQCYQCVVKSAITSFQKMATSWRYSPLTSMFSTNGTQGFGFASMIRNQVIVAQLFNSVDNETAQSCSGCSILFTAIGCSPSPTISPSGGARFDINGTARVSLTWPVNIDAKQNSTIRPYSCRLVPTAPGGNPIEGPSSSSFIVGLCYPTQIRLVNSTTDLDIFHRVLKTGNRYTFIVGMYDAYGSFCPGDDFPGVSTIVTVSLLYGDNTVPENIHVVNLNTSTQLDATVPYSNTAYFSRGRFTFNVVFTNATNVPVRLVFNATSAVPKIDSVVTTLSYVVVATSTRLFLSPVPPATVSFFRTYTYQLVATDLTPREWLASHNVAPNVDATSSADYEMIVKPSFFTVNPFIFASGIPLGNLVNGSTQFSIQYRSLVSESPSHFQFVSRYTQLIPTEVFAVTVQKASRIAFLSVGFGAASPQYLCSTNCPLPLRIFQLSGNQLVINSTTQFVFRVVLADDLDQYVTAEPGISIGCRVTGNASDVNIGFAPSLVQRGPLVRPLGPDGSVEFSVGFIGSTLNFQTGIHTPLQLLCYCAEGPCPPVQNVQTLPIVVNSFIPSNVSLNAVGNALIIKVPTELEDLDMFNLTLFRIGFMQVLNHNNITFIQLNNLNTSVLVTACLVERSTFGFADLRNTVCGSGDICTAKNLHNCPPNVNKCRCPGEYQQQGRLQVAQQAQNLQVQLEAMVTLENAPAFKPTSTQAIISTYQSMEYALVDSLSQPGNLIWKDFKVYADTILVSEVNMSVIGSTPKPTSRFIVATPRPVTQSPSSASRLTFIKELLAVLVISVLLLA